MRLVFPRIEHKEKAIDYINEFYEYGSAFVFPYDDKAHFDQK